MEQSPNDTTHIGSGATGDVSEPGSADAPVMPLDDTAHPVPPRTPSRIGRRELTWGTATALATGALTFGLLAGRAVPPDLAAAAPPPVAATARPPAPATQRWKRDVEGQWIARRPYTEAFELPAEDAVQIWMRTVRPLLVVVCDRGTLDAFVFTGTATRMEPPADDYSVTVRLDDAASRPERWPDSSEHTALFPPSGAAFTKSLTATSNLYFGFTPFNAAPVVARFAVGGLRDHLRSAPKACGQAR